MTFPQASQQRFQNVRLQGQVGGRRRLEEAQHGAHIVVVSSSCAQHQLLDEAWNNKSRLRERRAAGQKEKLTKRLAAAVGEWDEVVGATGATRLAKDGRVVGVAGQEDAQTFHHQIAQLLFSVLFFFCRAIGSQFHEAGESLEASDEHFQETDFPVDVFEDDVVTDDGQQKDDALGGASAGRVVPQQQRQGDELLAGHVVELEHDKFQQTKILFLFF